jgi:type II secretory pathway pseudopilin PulG
MIMVLLGLLAIVAIPKYYNLQADANLAAEKGVAGAVRAGIHTYFSKNRTYPATLDSATQAACSVANKCFGTVLDQEGVTSGWTKTASLGYQSSAGNTYIYKPSDGSFVSSSTPLGSTFSEITGNMIDLTQSFYDTNGRWPRSFGDYRYTDLGLNPADWSGVVYDGLIYGTGGSRLSIKPGEGWAITVMGLDGVSRVLRPSDRWNLWYDMPTSQWYYHDITPSQAIDISTMQKTQS